MISWHAPENSRLRLHFFTYVPGSIGMLGIHQVNRVVLVALGITIVFVLLGIYAGYCYMTSSLLRTTDGVVMNATFESGEATIQNIDDILSLDGSIDIFGIHIVMIP